MSTQEISSQLDVIADQIVSKCFFIRGEQSRLAVVGEEVLYIYLNVYVVDIYIIQN